MCSINLIAPPSGTVENFSADFEDCNQNNGDLQAERLFVGGLQTFYAVSGTDTNGNPYQDEILVDNADTVNPTKVFWAVVKVLKKTLCPTCS